MCSHCCQEQCMHFVKLSHFPCWPVGPQFSLRWDTFALRGPSACGAFLPWSKFSSSLGGPSENSFQAPRAPLAESSLPAPRPPTPMKVIVKVKELSRVRLFVTRWAVTCQAPQSTGFSRQEYWSGLPFPSPGDPPHPQGLNPGLLHCRQTLYRLSYQGTPLPYTPH